MDQTEGRVIALDDYRRRRQERRSPQAAYGSFAIVWVPVWVWVPMYALS